MGAPNLRLLPGDGTFFAQWADPAVWDETAPEWVEHAVMAASQPNGDVRISLHAGIICNDDTSNDAAEQTSLVIPADVWRALTAQF